MKYPILFSLFIFSLCIVRAAEAQYSVEPFYETDALVTDRVLPFAVKNSLGEPATISSITSPGGKCSVMVDPYRKHVLLLYCTAVSSVQIDVFVVEGQKIVRLPMPSMAIKKVSISSGETTPVNPSPVGNVVGQNLYNNNCKSCHTSIVLPKTTTAASLTAKFNASAAAKGPMTKFKNFFTAAELEALSKYINGEL
jgi:hypothetical protein